MPKPSKLPATAALTALLAAAGALGASAGCAQGGGAAHRPAPEHDAMAERAAAVIREGRQTFRFETFGDEDYWTGNLGLDRAVEGAAHHGVGPGLSPAAALGLGLKVDLDALPAALREELQAGKVDLGDPATTVALLDLDAVVGVRGKVGNDGALASLGITCALCHSTVDDAFAPGIGRRRDGVPNRDLNVGAIVGLAPDLSYFTGLLGVDEAAVRKVLAAWGPGKFDAELILDGKGFRPDGKTAATLIPPAFGLAGVNLATWTGWGSVTYWNGFVANLEMHGKGTFTDDRLDDASRFPLAARAALGHVHASDDRVTPRLASLHLYELSLPAPSPPAGSFDPTAAARGQAVFTGAGKCASCHVPPITVAPGWNMHSGKELGIDDFQASRSPDGRYRTPPLNGLSTHAKGGFYHDGRFGTLREVVDHYDAPLGLSLSPAQKADLVEYLKSL